MWQDLRFGARMMLRSPLLMAAAILSLALGIGANTAIFSVINALLLRPLPYREPDRLVKVYQAQPDPEKGMLPSIWSYPRYEILRDQNQCFAAVAGFKQNPYNLTGTDAPERLQGEMVSASYFPLLGIEPVVGRAFSLEEDRTPGANLVAMLGHGLWQRRYGGDPQIVGKTIELDQHSFVIVGVLPPDFRGQDGTSEVWVTMMAAPLLRFPGTLTAANNYWFQVIGRLKDGRSPAQTQLDLQRVGALIEQKYKGPAGSFSGTAKTPTFAPLQAAKVDPAIRKSFLILLVAVGLVLLIACANVANLLLARAVARQREFALRAALGAGRARLIRQAMTESLLLSFLGGASGILVARWGMELLRTFRPSDDASFWSSYSRAFSFFPVEMDERVLGFNMALTLLTGLLFGLVPALQSSFASPSEALKKGANSSTAEFHGLRGVSPRSLLVIGEIALSLVLLVGAGVMLKSLVRLQAVYLGFAPEKVITMAAPSRKAKPEMFAALLARLQALPGVEAASLGNTAPLLGYASKTVMEIEGRPEMKELLVGLHSVSPDYFKTLGIQVRAGRAFTPWDRAGAPRVALLNQSAAEKFFPGQNPIGKRIRPSIDPEYDTPETFLEIVGVVADVRYGRLEEAIEPDLYLSSLQPTDPAQVLILRSSLDPSALAAEVRREMTLLDRNVPLVSVQTMTTRAAEVTSRARFIAMFLGLFAGLAMLLAAIGVYGVMAYNVSTRAKEIGIRLAIGAGHSQVVRLMLRDGLKLIVAGIALGVCASLALLRVLQTQLYEVRATDPQTIIGGTLLLGMVGALACYLPARRAADADPLAALRAE